MASEAIYRARRMTMHAASIADLEAHRVALTGHCYRMLGSPSDADDAVQEALVRAWQHLPKFDGRASLGTWLYRIATNVCLDTISARKRDVRATRPSLRRVPARDDADPGARHLRPGAVGTVDDDLQRRPANHWLEPIPDGLAIPDASDPAEKAVLRQSIRLAFVAALQTLPPKQRASLLLTEVLGWSVPEVAESLATTPASVNSALQRARATLANPSENTGESDSRWNISPSGGELSTTQRELLERYVAAFERYDVDALSTLLREDAVLSMPPFTLWLQGPATIARWFLGRGIGCKGSRLLATSACGSPAFGQYRVAEEGGHRAWSLIVLELEGDRIATMTHFLDTETVFPRFGLPLTLPTE